jgi:hypothetical protein
VFLVQRPMKDAMAAVDVIATFHHGHVFELDITETDGTCEFSCFGDFRWGTRAGMTRGRGVSGLLFIFRVRPVIGLSSSAPILFILLQNRE